MAAGTGLNVTLLTTCDTLATSTPPRLGKIHPPTPYTTPINVTSRDGGLCPLDRGIHQLSGRATWRVIVIPVGNTLRQPDRPWNEPNSYASWAGVARARLAKELPPSGHLHLELHVVQDRF